MTVSKATCRRSRSRTIEQQKYALAVICSPIWTSHPSLPIRAYLSRQPQLPRRIALALTYGGHSPPGRAIEELGDLLSRPPETSISLKETQMQDGTFANAVDKFVARLTRAKAA